MPAAGDNGRAPEIFRKYGRALVVVAHPDDPEFLFGATIASLTDTGCVVSYLVCTNGENGGRDPRVPSAELTRLRHVEQQGAAGVLGVTSMTFLDLPDGSLQPTPALRLLIAREIRRVRPDLLITHYPARVLHLPLEASHPDHLAVGEAALAAVSPDAANPRACPGLLAEGLEPFRVREIWIPGYGNANHYVNAGPFLERKLEAIRCHHSQVTMYPDGEPVWVRDWMRRSGEKGGYQYAEDFWRIQVR